MLFKNQKQIVENGLSSELKKAREHVLDVLDHALDAVNPYKAVKKRFNGSKILFENKTVNISDFENIFLIGLGKASVGMAQAVCDSVDVKKGAVVTNDPDVRVEDNNVVSMVAAHPVPDQNSIEAADKILDIVKMCSKNDLLIVLISGGGSALFCKPRVELKEMQHTTDLLLKCGADINQINTIRKHLSLVKGGQLVKYAKGCTMVSLIISDIVNDPLEFIASGPTYPDSTTYEDAKKIFKKHDLWDKLPLAVKEVIEKGVHREISETPKSGDPIFNHVFNYIVANNKSACEAARYRAKQLGYKTMLLTTSLTGEARDMGKFLVDKTKEFRRKERSMMFISGGETTVTLKGKGKGGRNQEMVLAGVEYLDENNIVFASFATDGIDGNSEAAGAIADGFTLDRAVEKNLDPFVFLEENNSNKFFKNLDDLLITGPTGTNVMDIQVILKI